ncbi:MAG TPA: hypothetical protein ENI44_04230 [Thermoplasmatales archaeon]|nr:hypothetical protein [Thermoplasmatales archaeon]
MVRSFDRDLFIKTTAAMIGVVMITYFLADIVHQSKIKELTTQHNIEIESIQDKNKKFTSGFLESSVILDSAREDRAFGNYYFELASLFYNIALSEKNSSSISSHKNKTIDNCSEAMPKYLISHMNFIKSSEFFNSTIQYTDKPNYIKLLKLYVNLTKSGARLTLLRYNASKYLKYLAENITIINDSAVLSENATELMEMFNETMIMYGIELSNFEEQEHEIDEYDIEGFSPIREPT